jgi:hypothetical protein
MIVWLPSLDKNQDIENYFVVFLYYDIIQMH